MKIKCPNCRSDQGIRKIIFGMPSGPLDESKYLIGGCCVTDNDPTHECTKCGWQKMPLNKTVLELERS